MWLVHTDVETQHLLGSKQETRVRVPSGGGCGSLQSRGRAGPQCRPLMRGLCSMEVNVELEL